MPYHWQGFTPPRPQIAAAPVEDFVTAAHTFVQQATLLVKSHCFYQVLMTSVYMALRNVDFSIATAAVAQAVATVASCFVCAIAVRRCRNEGFRTAIVSLTALLATPYCFNYDMLAVSAAILPVFIYGCGIRVATKLSLAAVWLLPALVMIFNPAHLPLAPLLIAIATGMLLIEIFEIRSPTISTSEKRTPFGVVGGAGAEYIALATQSGVQDN